MRITSAVAVLAVTVLAEECTARVPIAGWVTVERPCSSQKPLPAIVRKCAGAAVTGALLAFATGGVSIWAGLGSGAAGCVPWAMGDD